MRRQVDDDALREVLNLYRDEVASTRRVARAPSDRCAGSGITHARRALEGDPQRRLPDSPMTRSWLLSPSTRRPSATAIVTGLTAVALLVATAPTEAPEVARAVVTPHEDPVPEPPQAVAVAARAPAEPESLATVAGVELVVPATDTVAVGFHQGGSTALTLAPGDADHRVMPSRGRATAATSAVDVAVGQDPTVTSPVTGTVTQVAEYALYGRHEDVLMTIEADEGDVTVQLMHVRDVTVEPGQQVQAGQPIAAARQLPMPSQVDRLHDGPAGPHVHLDVSAT